MLTFLSRSVDTLGDFDFNTLKWLVESVFFPDYLLDYLSYDDMHRELESVLRRRYGVGRRDAADIIGTMIHRALAAVLNSFPHVLRLEQEGPVGSS